METLDFVVIAISVIAISAIGFLFSKQASKSTEEFVLGGRRLPWWLAGTSASAGAFNADSPLHQSRKVRETGLAGAWFYWNHIIASIFSVIIMGKMYRRANITTVVEFYKIRYGGRLMNVGRFWYATDVSIIRGTGMCAMGILGLMKISQVLLQLPPTVELMGVSVDPSALIAIAIMALAVAYATVSGVLGVVWTDLIEFAVALGCSYILLAITYSEVGYADGLKQYLSQLPNASQFLSFSPELGFMLIFWFFIYQLASFDGAETDLQRYMAVRNEREVIATGMWRIVNHFILRGWPWYLCGLISLILISDAYLIDNFGALPNGQADLEKAYPALILEYLPTGLKGLMVAGFLSAFMSSIDTISHNNASIFVNDIYRPFVKPNRDEKHYVKATRFSMIASAILGCLVAFQLDQIWDLLAFFVTLKSCTGVVKWVRWFWWRINIKADLFAQFSAIPITLFFSFPEFIFGRDGFNPVHAIMDLTGLSGFDGELAAKVTATILVSCAGWVTVALLTKPDDEKVLVAFYKRVRPYGIWGPIRAKCADTPAPDSLSRDVATLFICCGVCFSLLFFVGSLFLAYWSTSAICFALSAIFIFVFRKLTRAPNTEDEAI